MKKFLVLALVIVTSCTYDQIEPPTYAFVPETLQIVEPVGLKLENSVVEKEVAINAKLPSEGTYRIKIKDIMGKTVSQELLKANAGDNILKIYVSALPVSSYTVELIDENNQMLGQSVFAMKN
jgi:hypothetical protein